MTPKISIIGPSHRTELWRPFYESIITNLDFEVIFVTDKTPMIDELPNRGVDTVLESTKYGFKLGNFNWTVSPVKPAQCFEIAYRASTGTHIIWTGDDFTYGPYALDHLYAMHKSFYDHKVMIACNVYQDGHPARHEHVVPWDNNIRLTTTGLISKQAIEEVGGFADSTFCCGHFDVDLMMRIYANGGRLFECPTAMAYEPHNQFHQKEANFAATWREELDYFTELWRSDVCFDLTSTRYKTLKQRSKPFIPYTNENILTISQGVTGKWK